MKKPNSTLLVLVIASMIGLYIFSKAFNYKYKQTETISVTGAADTNFVSDMIVWSGSFSRTSFNMQEAFDALKKDEEITETSDINEVIDEIIPPGWSYYKYTKFKHKLCGDTNSEVTIKIQKPFIEKKFEIIRQKVVLNEPEEIINALSLLHEKRTNEYKELWGEDEWERMFMCPNYDYAYFDKLDEAYEEEQAKLAEQYYNNNDSEDYDNY
jgi:hypothetical protein